MMPCCTCRTECVLFLSTLFSFLFELSWKLELQSYGDIFGWSCSGDYQCPDFCDSCFAQGKMKEDDMVSDRDIVTEDESMLLVWSLV